MRSSIAAACLLAAVAASGIASSALAQRGANAVQRPSSRMLQFPDVSAKDIVFVYANDLWIVPREGGMARPLASPPGRESFPKFSPDGKSIAFVGNYDGNRDIYTISIDGGPAHRVTHHPASEIVTDWTVDGKILYYRNGEAGLIRQEQIFTADPMGGMPTRLPVPYGTTGSISPDSNWLAYTPSTHDFRTWKRYRGGWAQDLWLFNLKDNSSRKITDWEGTDTIPMWEPIRGSKLFYLSDDGASHRLNIWSIDINTNAREQVTDFKEYDVKWPSIGPGANGRGEIVFQNGQDLYLLDCGTGATRKVEVTIPGDRPTLRPNLVDASKFIQSASLSPSGKRLALEARGDVWSLPAAEGVTRNLTRTSGAAERMPMFSPDGKWIAYLSDATGEYELYLIDADGKTEAKQLTTDGAAYRYIRSWSPDSKHILFTDKTGTVYLHTLGGEKSDGSAPGTTKQIVKELWGETNPEHSWSHDSGWIALTLGLENTQNAIWLYEVASGALTQVTSEMFDARMPAFDRKGEWLYYASSRNFSPTYSDLDSTWIYRNSELLFATPLRADIKNPLAPKSDEEEAAGEKESKKKEEAKQPFAGRWECEAKESAPGAGDGIGFSLTLTKNDDGTPAGKAEVMGTTYELQEATYNAETKTISFKIIADQTYTGSGVIDGETMKGTWTSSDGRSGVLEGKRTGEASKEPVIIEVSDFERRAVPLPVKPGQFRGLRISDSGKLVYLRASDGEGGDDLKIFDFFEDKPTKEEKTVISGINSFEMSADGKKLRVTKGGEHAVVDAAPDQKMEKKVPLTGMQVLINPREEWNQIFDDAWRIFRDFFYEPGLHQVDWPAQKTAYRALLQDCASRDDVTFVIAEMISELNVGHAYYRPGDQDAGPTMNVGLLGADYELVTQDGITAYRIAHIVEGGPWDSDARGPLSQPGTDVKVGDFILAVNRTPIDVSKDIWASFIGTADKTISITVSATPQIDDKAREVIVKPLSSEGGLRLRGWIEANRRYIDEKSNGDIGYIYVINTGVPGQSDLVRQFYGQRHKKALIIDDRWNGGGQIPTRFIELLNRPRTNYWARRDGKDWSWPRDSHQGPKAMLINGLSASGGDMFPALFRQYGLGKLIGTRTWGGLVGISGNPQFIDGTGANVPTFGYYEKDGTWGIEGHGVDPDMPVIDDPAKMIAPRGIVADPQIDAAIIHLQGEIAAGGYQPPAKPQGPDRKGMGLKDEDR